nr:hypothetical protein [Bacteroidota bacterium]
MDLPIAGYHILHLMCAVDNEFNNAEDAVIRQYLAETFPFPLSLDDEMEILSALHSDENMNHFAKCMDYFYADSTADERNRFFDMVVKLVAADKRIIREQNQFLDVLYDAWEPGRE